MTDSRVSPSLQLFEQVFSEEDQREKYADLNAYLEAGGSVFPLVEKGVAGLVRDFGLSVSDAQAYLGRANALAIHVRRQFIEQRLAGENTPSWQPANGLLSLVPGPSYGRLFPNDFESKCPPDALESWFSPVAYLIELLRWIPTRIEPVGDTTKKPLMARRTDLAQLVIDYNAVHQAVSSVDIIVPVLETFIKAHASHITDLEDAMIKARYPNGLPYYQSWATIDFVAGKNGLSVGDFAHQADLSFPYFLQPNAWASHAGRALLHASRLGPYQRQMLTEAQCSSESVVERTEFYQRSFGTNEITWINLNQVPFFCERTKLDTLGLEALLSIQSFAPVRSANFRPSGNPPAAPANGLDSGSVYLNGGGATPIDILVPEGGGAITHRLTEDVNEPARYDRMNRKLRLDNWLQQPPEQVDALLMAAIRAEETAPGLLISENTVQALGLFQLLREHHGCTAEDFAAFIGDMSVYGRGEELSQFDRVFNAQGDIREPLRLDDGEFAALPPAGQASLTISQLCNGLNIDLRTYQYLALAITQAHGRTDMLARTPSIISGFFRLVKLSRLLQITPAEGVLMLLLLGGEPWLNALAGTPKINKDPVQGPPDVLNIIVALQACVAWCKGSDLPVLWMLQQVAPPVGTAAASADDLQLFGQVRNLISGALFSNALLLAATVPPLAGGLDWLDLLGSVVDSDGLVLSPQWIIEAEYPAFARLRLEIAVKDGLGDGDAVEQAAIVEKMLAVLLQARGMQASVVKESVAVYAGLESGLVPAVLEWSNLSVHQLLRQVLDRTKGLETATLHQPPEDDADPLLILLADLRRRSAVVVELELSADLLRDYLDYGYKAWLGQEDKYAFTLSTLYYLTVLTRAFAMSDQAQSRLLDYLREVHVLPDPLGGDATELARRVSAIRLAAFFGWSVQDVRECASRVDDQRIIRNLRHLDLLMRVRVLAKRSGMDAQTIFMLGTLPGSLDKLVYDEAARHALLSLSDVAAPLIATPDDAQEQTVKLTCVVDNSQVVAGNADEKATFTVTLTDLENNPLSGVKVYWQASLGRVETVATGVNGEARAEYRPGKVMGTDTPLFWLDLHEKHHAPRIEVIADYKTLEFPAGYKSPVPLGTVPVGQEVELYAMLKDQYNNYGQGMLVTWSSSPVGDSPAQPMLIIRPGSTFTDREGYSRVFVSSPTGGTFVVSALSQASEKQTTFERITFAQPD